jgi:hypothetical protein
MMSECIYMFFRSNKIIVYCTDKKCNLYIYKIMCGGIIMLARSSSKLKADEKTNMIKLQIG